MQSQTRISGTHAVLGMDVVSFSTLTDEEQLSIIGELKICIKQSLAYHGVGEEDYCWSPAGDGGYLTFATPSACNQAIDVAFSICDKVRKCRSFSIRLGLHSGTVTEGSDFSGDRNVWGIGINIVSRILAIASPYQLLVSKQYFDTFIQPKRRREFEVGESYSRTVKHGFQIEVMNFNQRNICIDESEAEARRWESIGGLWRKTIREYEFLIRDAMTSGEPIAALAAAKFLLDLDKKEPVEKLCHAISGSPSSQLDVDYPRQVHQLFSQMTSDVLIQIIEKSSPILCEQDDTLFSVGETAKSCFFPIAGKLAVEIPGIDQPIRPDKGQIIGEFNLWLPSISRTGTLRALDDGLLLEIRTEDFQSIIRGSQSVEKVVYELIRRRIIENIIRSERVFPGLVRPTPDSFSCNKYREGDEIDLTSTAHIVFCGTIQIEPSPNIFLNIQSNGMFGSEEVLGILSDLEKCDGEKGFVLKEAVTVSIPHKELKQLQSNSENVRNAWNRLAGERQGNINRLEKRN